MEPRALIPLLATLLLTAACSPQLKDGFYSCATGPCPAGWFCRADELCYRAETPHVSYRECTESISCETSLCARVEVLSPVGQCSIVCDSDDDCPDRAGDPSTCRDDDTCAGGCSLDNPCTGELVCAVTRFGSDGRPIAACAAEFDLFLVGGMRCIVDGDCLSDMARCVNGMCARPCGEGLACATRDGEACVFIGEGLGDHCALECATDDDCIGLPCLATEGGQFCLPGPPTPDPTKFELAEFDEDGCLTPESAGRICGPGSDGRECDFVDACGFGSPTPPCAERCVHLPGEVCLERLSVRDCLAAIDAMSCEDALAPCWML